MNYINNNVVKNLLHHNRSSETAHASIKMHDSNGFNENIISPIMEELWTTLVQSHNLSVKHT